MPAVNDTVQSRVVLALDATLACHEALESAAELALLLRGELDALFLEDQDLAQLAALPCTVEIHLRPTRSQASLAAGLQQAATRARDAFEEVLYQHRLHGEFRTVRGQRREVFDAQHQRGDVLWFNYRSSLTRPAPRSPVWRDTLYVLATATAGGEHVVQLAKQLQPAFHRVVLLSAAGAVPAGAESLLAQPNVTREVIDAAGMASPQGLLAWIENRSAHCLLLADDAPLAADRDRLLDVMGPLRTEVLLVH